MELKSKTVEKAAQPEAAQSHAASATQQPQNPVAQALPALTSIQRAAGNQAIQRVALQRSGGESLQPGPATHAALKQADRGEHLPSPLRTTMERFFHSDLSNVRLHTDSQASTAAQELHAQAFTLGQDIYFGTQRYQPTTVKGQQLLAHELTHTLQQSAAKPPVAGKLETSQPGDATEQEAAQAETAYIERQSANSTPIHGMQIARQPLDAGAATQPSDTGTPSAPAVPTLSPPAAGSEAAPVVSPPGAGPAAAPPTPSPSAAPVPVAGTPSTTTELIFPPFTLFEGEEKTTDLLDLSTPSYPLLVVPIELPPPLFLATVGLYAKVDFKLELFLRYGPAVIRDIRLALDPLSHRYSGTAQLYLPVAFGPRATLRGSLTGSLDWLGLVEVLAIEGGLAAIGQAPIILAFGPSINLIYDSGTFSFNLRPQVEAGVALTFDFNAFAQARFGGDVIWKKIWNLYHWQWGRAVRFGSVISLDYIHGGLQPIRTQEFGERITIDELLQGMKEPAQGGGIQVIPGGKRPPLQDRLHQLLETSGGDPHTILAVLAEGSDSERAAVLADTALMSSLQSTIGNELWPTAQRILTNAPSETTPSLDEGTVFLVNRHIALGRFQDALQALVSRLQGRGVIDATLCTFTYARETTAGEGLTTTNYNVVHGMYVPIRPSKVQIYDPAFANAPWLYSTIMHEYTHVLQQQREITPAMWADPEAADRAEVEAYLWEIEHARGSGVIASPAQMQEIGQRLTDHFTALTPTTQALYRDRYNDAMALVRAATSGRAPVNLTFSIADARRLLQETSRRIAQLVRERTATSNPADIARIDGEIAALQRERAEALVEVVLAENPTVQVVDRGKGIYRVPVVDGTGQVQWIYGSITVLWHLHQVSPSVFAIGADIRSQSSGTMPPGTIPPGTTVDTRLLLGGSAIQSRVQPFPGDIDFAEEFDISAPTAADAGTALAETIADFVGRNIGNPNLEFVSLRIMPPRKGSTTVWSQTDILDRSKRASLAAELASVGGGRINTSWRALIDGGRFIEITKVLNVHALSSATGGDLFSTEPSGAEFQESYLDEAPPQIEPSLLGWYAQLMRTKAISEAAAGNYLKAAKRAFNYLRAIGNLEGIETVTAIFATQEARVNQQVAVLEALTQALNPATPSRILTVNTARDRLNETATLIDPTMPTEAAELRAIATAIRGVSGSPSDPVAPDPTLSAQLDIVTKSIKSTINSNLKLQVEHIIDTYVR